MSKQLEADHISEKDQLLKNLNRLCKDHNYYWRKTENFTEWSKGRSSHKTIVKLIEYSARINCYDEAIAIYKKYKPEE